MVFTMQVSMFRLHLNIFSAYTMFTMNQISETLFTSNYYCRYFVPISYTLAEESEHIPAVVWTSIRHAF
jgi:hypothetical protein